MDNNKLRFQTGSQKAVWFGSRPRDITDEEDVRPNIFEISTQSYFDRLSEQEKKQSVLPVTMFEGQTISSPQSSTPSLSRATMSQREMLRKQTEEQFRSAGAPLRNFFRNELGGLGKLLFGESESEFRGKTARKDAERDITGRTSVEGEGFWEGFKNDMNSRGLVRFLYQNVLMENNEKSRDGQATLMQQGWDRNTALQIATQYYEQGKESISDKSAVALLETNDFQRTAWAVVELLDLTPIFSGFVKSASKTFVRQKIAESMSAQNATEARRILSEISSDLTGTTQLDDIVALTRQARDPVRGEQLFNEIAQQANRTRVVPDTPAQQIFYEGGIPVVRAGADAQQPIRESLKLRDEIRSAVAGEMEAARLSNPNVFLSEVKAGAIPFKQEIGSKVKMFVPDEITSLRTGDRLATSREIIEQSLKTGKARTIEVLPDDLVRLADGTFAYIPKKAVGLDIAPTLRNIREGQRAKVAEIERNRALVRAERARIQKQITERQAARKAEEAQRAKAVRAEEVQKARVTAETGEASLKARTEGLRAERAVELSKIRETAKVAREKIREGERTMRTLLSGIRKNDKTASKVRDNARKQIDRIRSLVRATPAEKKKRIDRVRKTRDRELARLKKEKDVLQKKARTATEALNKARKEMPDVARETARIRTETKRIIDSDRTDTLSAVARARELLKTEEAQKQAATSEKAKVQSVKATNEHTQIFKDNFSNVRETTEASKTTIPSPSTTQPLKGTGEVVVNKVAKAIQAETDEALKLAGVKNGIQDVIDGTAKIDGDTLAKLSPTHRVAHNVDQLKSAIIRVGKDPEKAYFDFISSNAMDDSMAALYSALVRSDFVASDLNRMNNIIRHFDKFGTRTAQELQARQLVGKMDYPNIVSKLMRQSEEIMNKRGIKITDEVTKIEKILGDEFDKLIAISKADAVEQLTKITCKV